MIEGCTRLSPTAVSSTAVVQSNIHTTRLHVDASSSPLLTLHVIELCLREGIGKNGGADPERASGISLELGSDRRGADEDTDALPRAEGGWASMCVATRTLMRCPGLKGGWASMCVAMH